MERLMFDPLQIPMIIKDVLETRRDLFGRLLGMMLMSVVSVIAFLVVVFVIASAIYLTVGLLFGLGRHTAILRIISFCIGGTAGVLVSRAMMLRLFANPIAPWALGIIMFNALVALSSIFEEGTLGMLQVFLPSAICCVLAFHLRTTDGR
jgi:hypothetical protein